MFKRIFIGSIAFLFALGFISYAYAGIDVIVPAPELSRAQLNQIGTAISPGALECVNSLLMAADKDGNLGYITVMISWETKRVAITAMGNDSAVACTEKSMVVFSGGVGHEMPYEGVANEPAI